MSNLYKGLKRTIRDGLININGSVRKAANLDRGKRIITFHDIADASKFKEKMIWLKENFSIVSMEDLLNKPSNERIQVAITFDDGFSCWHEKAAPVLEELDIPAVFFVCSGLVGGSKNASSIFIKEVLHRTRPLEALSLTQLRELSDCSLFEIGGHTINHTNLGNILPTEKLEDEINHDQQQIADWIGRKPRWFAYPYGKPCNISKQSMEFLQESSYEAAFTITPNFITNKHNKYLLPRDSLSINDSNKLWMNWLSGGYKRSMGNTKSY